MSHTKPTLPLHLQNDLQYGDVPSYGLDEVRPYRKLKTVGDAMQTVLKQHASHRLQRKIEEKNVLLPDDTQEDPLVVQPNFWQELQTLGSLEQPITFDGGDKPEGSGRSLIGLCYARGYLNTTIRKEKSATGHPQNIATTPIRSPEVKSGYAPDTNRKDFLFSINDACHTLLQLTPTNNKIPAPGLIIIAGGTGSGKSQITRGMIYHLLFQMVIAWKPNEKRPHFLTIENPIEKYLFLDRLNPQVPYFAPDRVQESFGLDYTPRQMPQDTPHLEQALMRDALRQTANLVYVGEIRDPQEFRTVLDFAETGHSIITTMHAGSLREAMQRILAACDAKTPSARGEIASRINAIIYLDKMTEKADGKTVTLPSLWRKTPSAIANLVADGLSSVSPSRGREATDPASYCLGRAHFLDMMLRETGQRSPTNEKYAAVLREAILKDMGIEQ